jgi:hypothetical protein
MVDYVIDAFGPFDDISASSDVLLDTQEWRGTWDGSYTLSEDLIASANVVETFKDAQSRNGIVWDKPSVPVELEGEVETSAKVDEDKRDRITKTLAWLHSRGEILTHAVFLLILQVYKLSSTSRSRATLEAKTPKSRVCGCIKLQADCLPRNTTRKPPFLTCTSRSLPACFLTSPRAPKLQSVTSLVT